MKKDEFEHLSKQLKAIVERIGEATGNQYDATILIRAKLEGGEPGKTSVGKIICVNGKPENVAKTIAEAAKHSKGLGEIVSEADSIIETEKLLEELAEAFNPLGIKARARFGTGLFAFGLPPFDKIPFVREG